MVKKKIKAGITNLQSFVPPVASPDELIGELLRDVQLSHVHPDSKTFVDLVSERKLRRIAKAYRIARQDPNFDLQDFVMRHFHEYLVKNHPSYHPSEERSACEYIEALWPALTRSNYRTRGTLMPLPYPYIVPGGRFVEQYYWDAYFTMVGLEVGGHTDLVEDMVKNYAYLIRKVGFIPTANRTYYLTRSQPPYFAQMVQLLAKKRGKRAYVQYLPYLLAEYRFWMRGRRDLDKNNTVSRRVVRMPDGSILNRYYDAKHTPRPESYREDTETALQAKGRPASRVYLDIRAAAESGWDFSSRWLKGDSHSLSTIHTTDIIPVDLNCLLYELELTIAKAYRIVRQSVLAKRFEKRARNRAHAIRTYCWSEQEGFYFDYDFVKGDRTPSQHIAAAYPLYHGIASSEEAERIAGKLERDFLKDGGFVTTLEHSGQQWDAPNGWAPMQWIAYKGLKRYGYDGLADETRHRWIVLNTKVYESSGKFFEKYNVINPGAGAGGGEYVPQDGFGWTNGVYVAMDAEQNKSSTELGLPAERNSS